MVIGHDLTMMQINNGFKIACIVVPQPFADFNGESGVCQVTMEE